MANVVHVKQIYEGVAGAGADGWAARPDRPGSNADHDAGCGPSWSAVARGWSNPGTYGTSGGISVQDVKINIYNLLLVEGLHNDAVTHPVILVPNSSGNIGPRVAVRQSPTDATRLFFDFDPAAPGGRGGASVWIDPGQRLASIDGVHKNVGLPPRSTGALLAEGLQQSGMPQPAILEGYNVEKTTASALAAGGNGQGTRIGNMLEDAARALGGTLTRWEPIKDGNIWRLRAHISYP